ncbi:MAG: TldD/PmbA family protein [Chloroflexi bacterium]|uniref:TldD/PmbA family protein n=1 Tax=Candidatus Chlorohelix allophototropha TaxID=3003348 RepID=A0A8T7LVU9_9CHLR|nr:TldD/PmbA family protein [Chloroflexota bacterium]WJW66914.1 TldD/PmbA family protein [Chloroflexota bacterium L227-S17]
MRDLANIALDAALLRGATYADIRFVTDKTQNVQVKNGVVESLSLNESAGFGVRVVADGAWGFSSSSLVTRSEIERVTAEAVAIAKASASVHRRPVQLGNPVSVVAKYSTPVEIPVFSVPIEQQIELLLQADATMRSVKGIHVAKGFISVLNTSKIFASSEGSYIEQELSEAGAGIECYAVGEGSFQRRSYPNSEGGQWETGGYEVIPRLVLPEHANRIAEQAIQLLTAPICPNKVTTLVLDASQVALQVHESCGHPTELDRVFGMEASFAGTSFLTTEKLGKLKYGSDIVNITADATAPRGLGTFGYDDEGIKATRTPLVQNGLFVNYLTDRETAAVLGQQSNGTARADSWNRIPLIRMTNINLEPGNGGSLDDLIGGVDDGIYMETNKSWSIDDKRLNFQFGLEAAWEIKNGKLGQLYRNPAYTGMTPQFWGSAQAIGSRDSWNIWAIPNCGKGEPMQGMHVGHGAAPVRFHNIKVFGAEG